MSKTQSNKLKDTFMNELIKLQPQTINGNTVETVSARELYEQLGLDKSNWSRWSKSNIIDNPFALENVDFVGFVIMTKGMVTHVSCCGKDFLLILQLKLLKSLTGKRVIH